MTAVSVHPGICETALLPLYGHSGATATDGAVHVVRLCDPAVEIVNGAYYDRDERVAPAPAARRRRTTAAGPDSAEPPWGGLPNPGPARRLAGHAPADQAARRSATTLAGVPMRIV